MAGWVSQTETPQSEVSPSSVWSIWSRYFVDWLSSPSELEGSWALVTVLSIHLRAPDGAGYTSTAAVELRDALRQNLTSDGGGSGTSTVAFWATSCT